MKVNNYLKRNWKLILNLVTIAALIILVVGLRHQLAETIKNLGKVKAWTLLLMIPIELLNYHAQTKQYQTLFNIVDERLSYKLLFKFSLELNFVNHVFPSGGVSGISYFGLRLRNQGIRAGKSTLVQLIKLVLIFTSFEILLFFGMLTLSISGRVDNLIIFIGTALTILVVATTATFLYVVSDRDRIKNFFKAVTKIINRVIGVFRPSSPETISLARVKPLFEELHDGYGYFKSRSDQIKTPFLYALLANLTEVAVIYVVFIAFGRWVNPGAIILAYAVANFAGFVSVLPGGIGVYEVLMTAVLVLGGVPAALSISAIVMYRVLNTLLQVPMGYYYYHRNLTAKPVQGGDGT